MLTCMLIPGNGGWGAEYRFLHFKYRSQAQSMKFAHKKTLLVLSDALADEDYRCLIVKLKTTAIK